MPIKRNSVYYKAIQEVNCNLGEYANARNMTIDDVVNDTYHFGNFLGEELVSLKVQLEELKLKNRRKSVVTRKKRKR